MEWTPTDKLVEELRAVKDEFEVAKMRASLAFAERLHVEEGVVVLPGAGFGEGGEGFFRISFIVAPERLVPGISAAHSVSESAMTASLTTSAPVRRMASSC